MRSFLCYIRVLSLTLGWLVAAHAVGQSPEFHEKALSEGSFQVGAWASVNVQLISQTEADTKAYDFFKCPVFHQ